MRKSLKLFLATLLIGGFAFSFSSCSDKDVNENSPEIPGDPYYKTSEEGEALGNILGAVAGLDSLPDNWKDASFTAEPTMGKVLDASNPHVRSVASFSKQEAIDIFQGLTGNSISNDVTSQSWTKDGVGTLSLNIVNKDGLFATIDVNMPKVPHLTQLRFVDKSLIGENGSFDGEAYYHIGDVIKVTENGEESNWVCVRCCNSAYGKEQSHWISFQLNKDNYYTAKQTKKRAQMIVPTKLGYNSDTERMLKYATEFFTVLQDPDGYRNEERYPEGIGGLGRITYTAADVTTIAKQWENQHVFEKVFPASNYKVFKDEVFYYGRLQDNLPITYYVKGYSCISNMSLYGVNVWVDENNKFKSEYNSEIAKWSPDDKSFNIDTYVKAGVRQWSSVEKADNPAGRTADRALVVRYKTGAQLCKQEGVWGTANDPDPTKPLPNYNDKKTKITIQDVYHYDGKRATDYVFGDMVKSSDGSIWTCVMSPCGNYNKYIFVTTDNIKTDKDGKTVINEDLATVDDIFKLYPNFYILRSNSSRIPYSEVYDALTDPEKGAVPLADYMQIVTYKQNDDGSAYRTTFAVKSTNSNQQQLLRIYADGCSNRKSGIYYKGFTTYMDNEKMYLSDVAKEDLVKQKNANDTLVMNFWPKDKNEAVYRNTTGHELVWPYLYYRKGATMQNGSTSEGGFADKDHFSIFNEPVAIIRVRVLSSGEANDFTLYQSSPCPNIQTWQLMMTGGLGTVFADPDYVQLNGERYSLSYR